MQLLETHVCWSTSHANYIFNPIFNDLTWKHNLPIMRNKTLHLMLRCHTHMSWTSGPASC